MTDASVTWRFGYDALLRPVWLENPAGERHTRRYNARGHVAAETTFTGATRAFTYDASYRVVRSVRPDASSVTFAYDDADRLLVRESGDGTRVTYGYDAAGRVVAASLHAGERVSAVTIERDRAGRPAREVQSMDQWTFGVERTFDAAGRVVLRRYSSGWDVALSRTLAGAPAELRTQGDEVGFFYDGCGREVARERKDIAQRISTARDVTGLPTRVSVVHDARPLRERSFTWSATGPLAEVDDARRGTRTYELDGLGRTVAAHGLGADETLAYSKVGMPIVGGHAEGATAGRGGRMLRAGSSVIAWDELGRLAAKRDPDPRKSWEYRYDASDRLVMAIRGDGARTEYFYDPMGRRIAESRGGVVTWFGWDGDSAVEEQPTDGPRVLRVFGDDGWTPLLESAKGGDLRMIAADGAGTPWAYVDRDGRVDDIDLTALGAVAFEAGEPGTLRFAGQRADTATGLCYQRFRYYAPDLGVFTTPDPLGIIASPYDIGFVPNPTYCVDPLGLETIIIQGPEEPGDSTGIIRRAAQYDADTIPGARIVPWSAVQPGSGALASADSVIIDAHGMPGRLLLGQGEGPVQALPPTDPRLVDGTTIGNALTAAGFRGGPGRAVVVGACNGATAPSVTEPSGGVAQAIANSTGSPTWGAEPFPAFRADARALREVPYAPSPTGTAVPGEVPEAGSGAPGDVVNGQWSLYTARGGGTPLDHARGTDYVRVERRANINCDACRRRGQNPRPTSPTDGAAAQGHPVDVVTGAMFTPPQVDFTLPGFFALTWTRTYSTANASVMRGLGFGWMHEHHWTAEGRGGERFLVTSPAGEELEIALPEGATVALAHGRVLARRGAEISLLVGDGLWRILRPCPDGVFRLVELLDASDNVARFEWTNDELTGLVDTAGRRADLVTEGGVRQWLVAVPDDDDGGVRFHALARYEIDGKGDLVAATDSRGRTTRYTYDRRHFLLTEERADGLVYHFRYEDVDDVFRCVETWGELPGEEILRDLGGVAGDASGAGIFHAQLQFGPEHGTTTALDAVGARHRYVGNALGQVTRYVDPRGVVQTYEYDDKGVLLATTDGLGRVSARAYDARGRLVSQTEPGDRVTQYVYDDGGALSEVVVPGGGVFHRNVDERGRLVALTDPAGAVTRFERDAHGQLTRVTWPAGGFDTMAYDAAGNRTRHARAGLGTWAYDYDALGNLLTITDPENQTTKYRYDAHGNHIATHRPGARRTTYDLDALKRKVVTRYPDGARARHRYVGDALVEVTFEGRKQRAAG